ncbi:hypothetical protein ACLB1N_15930 [Escherichia coli]
MNCRVWKRSEVEKPIVEVTDADVDGMLDTLRKQQATWKEKDGAVEAEDRVTIDFTGSVGEEFEGGKASDFVLAMGQGGTSRRGLSRRYQRPQSWRRVHHRRDLPGRIPAKT